MSLGLGGDWRNRRWWLLELFGETSNSDQRLMVVGGGCCWEKLVDGRAL